MGDETATLSEIQSLTLEQLRAVRREQRLLFDAATAHSERLGRVARDLNELKSDMVLMENKWFSADGHVINIDRKIEALTEKIDASTTRLSRIEAKLDSLADAFGKPLTSEK